MKRMTRGPMELKSSLLNELLEDFSLCMVLRLVWYKGDYFSTIEGVNYDIDGSLLRIIV